jgi:hypothetical protein
VAAVELEELDKLQQVLQVVMVVLVHLHTQVGALRLELAKM